MHKRHAQTCPDCCKIIMHLNECFRLAFSRPAADVENISVDANQATTDSHGYTTIDLPFLANYSPPSLEQPQVDLVVEGSLVSVLKCIASDCGVKAHTNFYIPPEKYAGYSYLFEDDELGELHAHRRHPAFVHAEEPNNLHTHHYDVYKLGSTSNSTQMTLTAMHSTINLTNHRRSDDVLHSAQPPLQHQAPMTVPYIHPHLEMPVPPLHLPWYFGALCFSFSFAGVVGLFIPPKWYLCGGGRVGGEMGGRYKKHWFPWVAFSWALTLCQGPCSFLADYVHMTNISPWHTIDRFIALFMMASELVKLIALRLYTRPLIYTLYLTCCAAAVFCFIKSQEAQETLNAEGFIFWHNGWHAYPIAEAIVYFIEIALNWRWGEHYSFEECEVGDDEKEECTYKRGERGGILLSTIAMSQLKASHSDTTPEKGAGTNSPDEASCNRLLAMMEKLHI